MKLALTTLHSGFLKRMPNRISTILVGLGKIGVGYDLAENGFRKEQTYTHLKSILDNENFSADAIIDTDPLVLKRVAKLCKVNSGTTFLPFLNSKGFDLLVIACPTSNHLKVLKHAVDKVPFKYLLIEKPVGESTLECLKIQELARSREIEVFVNYFRRYLRTTKEVKSFLSSIQKGAFLSAQIKSYGTLINIFSHFIDLSLEISGEDIFCSCKKIIQSNHYTNIFLHCDACESEIILMGINDSKIQSEVVLDFENVKVCILNNGFDFEVWDKCTYSHLQFKSTPYEINNYQQLVYSKISTVLDESNSLSGLSQALTVHKFLESIYSSHG